MSLSNAYGVSCRARAERVGATHTKRLAAISPEGARRGARCWLFGSPASPRWAVLTATGRTQRLVKVRYLPELICLQKRGNLSSKTRAARFPAREPHACTAACGPRPRLRRVDLGLAGQVCVVTGASRGIGLATARALCAEGASVLLVARSRERARGGAARRCRAAGGERRGPACDVTDPDAGERMLAEAREPLGRARRARQQRRHRALARPRRRPRRGLAGGLGAERDGIRCARCARSCPACASAAGAAS